MKHLFISLISLFLAVNLNGQESHEFVDTLVVHVQNIKKAKGKIWIAVYDQAETFLGEEVVVGESFDVVKTGDLVCPLVLAHGSYALSIFHDINANDKLDTKIFGIPKEPYCFSQNARKAFRAPRFHEAAMDFVENKQTVYLKLR
jgi:uncharacterized protein (DUF2141 family)